MIFAVAYAQIDWHDFVVVETVDYQPYETGNFPPPTNPDEVGARVLMEERMNDDVEMQIESDAESDDGEPNAIRMSTMESRLGQPSSISYIQSKRDNIQVQDMDEASSDDDESGGSKLASVASMLPPTHDKVVIKKYDPKQVQKPAAKTAATDEYLISPITGERIPASKVAEHMRIGLLDPRWVEQRDKHTVDKLNQDNVYAIGTAIEASLKQLAERRTDIFGVGDEETGIGKKLGEEETRKDERVTWDGHTSSVEAATRAARAHITLEDQIHQIHKVKGLLPDEEKEKIGPKPSSSGIPYKPHMPQQMGGPPVPMNVVPKPPQIMPPGGPGQIHAAPPPGMMMPMRPPMIRKCTPRITYHLLKTSLTFHFCSLSLYSGTIPNAIHPRNATTSAAGTSTANPRANTNTRRRGATKQEAPRRGQSPLRNRVLGHAQRPSHHPGPGAERQRQTGMATQRPGHRHQHRADRHRDHTQGQTTRGNWSTASQAEDFLRRHVLQRQQFNCVLQFAERHHRSFANQRAWWSKEVNLI